MKRLVHSLYWLSFASVASSSSGMAQVDPVIPVPGGATAATVVCLQAGDLTSGAFVGTYLQVANGGWERKAFLKPDVTKFVEMKRDDVSVELFDSTRSLTVKFDFESKRTKFARSADPENWKDLAHILNASDKDGSADCIALASRSGSSRPSAGSGGGSGSPIVNVFIRPGTRLDVPPGTRLTATSGPPCPGNPGFFLCPNKFTCAPDGGVCCPGAGACDAGTFCDRFINAACIGAGDVRFCTGSGNLVTGVSLHCEPGKQCVGDLCVP